jgi:hypothetical protein
MSVADGRPTDSMLTHLKEGTQLMSIYQPYFYVIQDIRSGMYYAGARWAQGCHPDELLKEDGYLTSSNTIKELIREHGLDTFTIRKIRTVETANEAYDYETRFLRKIKARKNPRFYNGHENDYIFPSFGTIKYKNFMMEKYGCEHPSKIPNIQDKIRNTNLTKYGVEWYTQTEEYKARVAETNIKRYGVYHHLMSKDVQRKREETNIEIYGFKAPQQNKNIQDKTKQTIKLKYGHNIVNVSQAEEVKRKKEETNLSKRGVNNPSKDPIIKERKRLQQIEKSNRECVIKLRCLLKQHKILLPKSWYLKDEKYIQEKIIEIEKILNLE